MLLVEIDKKRRIRQPPELVSSEEGTSTSFEKFRTRMLFYLFSVTNENIFFNKALKSLGEKEEVLDQITNESYPILRSKIQTRKKIIDSSPPIQTLLSQQNKNNDIRRRNYKR